MNDKNLKAMVACYSLNKAMALNDMLEYYRGSENLKHAIERAGKCWIRDGVLSSHQRCISGESMKAFQDALPTIINKTISNFDELYDQIERLNICGIGELMNYDTALRLGAYLKLLPERIYLQRGAADGFTKLADGFTKLREIRAPRIAAVNEFPPALRELEPYHIENFLCICMRNPDCYSNKLCRKTCNSEVNQCG